MSEEIHYLTVPAEVPVVNPLNEEPVMVVKPDGSEKPLMISWQDIVRNLFSAVDIIVGIIGDVGRYYDLRQKLISAKEGEVVPLSPTEFAALSAVAKKAEGFKQEFKLSVIGVMRSIYESPTTDPRGKKTKESKK